MSDKIVRIFGVPMDLGQNRRGVDMGPSAVRCTRIHSNLRKLGYTPLDEGNIAVSQAEEPLPTESGVNAHYLPQVAQICQETYERITDRWRADEFALFIGGDHSISIATVAAAASHGQIGVIWVDAHTDMNTPETSPSGNIHGMPVAVLLGDGPEALARVGGKDIKLSPAQIAMIGVRSVDAIEAQRVRKSGIDVYTMREIDEQGIAAVARQVLSRFDHLDRIHVSFDLDSLDPRHAPGVGTPVIGGLTYREAHLLMEIFADSGKVKSMDLVEINPILDTQNRTAEIGVEMMMSLLGKQIL
jgi:arginase